MRFRHLTFVPFTLLTVALFATVVASTVPDLPSLQWKHRVLLLFAPDDHAPALVQQRSILDADPKGLDERNIRVFAVTDAAAQAADLRRQFDVSADQFAVVLIGKDGGRKLKKNAPVELAALYGKIDAMPMRRDEMRRAGSEKP